jgi:hypothetical protein
VTHDMNQKPFVCAVCGNLIACGEGHYRAGIRGIHVACYEKRQKAAVLGAPIATVTQPRRRSDSSGTVPAIIGLIGILAAIAISPSVTQAGSLTDQVNGERLTVLKVDSESGSVKCVEDRRWRAVKKADLVGIGAGDVVRVERQRLILLRTAAEEIAGTER